MTHLNKKQMAQVKQKRLSQIYAKSSLTRNQLADIARDQEEPLHKRRAAFGLITQEYRLKINLSYPTKKTTGQ